MDIIIDKQLRELRQKRGNTQEDLANFLDISFQAVSKWERGESLPDISLLPKIAAYYDVTVDELLGVGEIRKKEKIDEYEEKGMKLRNKGMSDEDLKLWREAQSEFPNEMNVLYNLMYALFRTGATEEAMSIGERILRESTNDDYRSGAIQVLCFAHNALGDKEKAKEYARMGGNLWTTRSFLMERVLDGEERKEHNLDALLEYLDLIGLTEVGLCMYQDYERYLWLHEFYLKMMELYFDDGFYGFYACRAVQRHHWLARIYLGVRNDEEKTREHLEAAEKFAEQYDSLSGEYVYTSTLLNGHKGNADHTSKDGTNTQTEDLLEDILDSHFDRLHDRDWFKALEQRLRDRIAK